MLLAKLCRKDAPAAGRSQAPPRAQTSTKPTAESCLLSDFQPLDQRTKPQGHSHLSDLSQIF